MWFFAARLHDLQISLTLKQLTVDRLSDIRARQVIAPRGPRRISTANQGAPHHANPSDARPQAVQIVSDSVEEKNIACDTADRTCASE